MAKWSESRDKEEEKKRKAGDKRSCGICGQEKGWGMGDWASEGQSGCGRCDDGVIIIFPSLPVGVQPNPTSSIRASERERERDPQSAIKPHPSISETRN